MKLKLKKMQINLEALSESEIVFYKNIEDILKKSVYLKSDYKLYHLCAQINYSILNTSRLIKKIYGMSYFDLISFHRILYFDKRIKECIKNNERYSITNLIKQSGFESRSLFYIKFKEIKGMSPKEFYGL